jgi:hypothetical protein
MSGSEEVFSETDRPVARGRSRDSPSGLAGMLFRNAPKGIWVILLSER